MSTNTGKFPKCGFEHAEGDRANRQPQEQCRQRSRLLGRPRAKLLQGRRNETFIRIQEDSELNQENH